VRGELSWPAILTCGRIVRFIVQATFERPAIRNAYLRHDSLNAKVSHAAVRRMWTVDDGQLLKKTQRTRLQKIQHRLSENIRQLRRLLNNCRQGLAIRFPQGASTRL